MKLLLAMILLTCSGHAQLAGEVRFELLDKTADIVGDPQILQNKARESWNNKCESWKKELRSLNPPGQASTLLAANCNEAECKVDGGRTTCRSKGSYQIRVRMTE